MNVQHHVTFISVLTMKDKAISGRVKAVEGHLLWRRERRGSVNLKKVIRASQLPCDVWYNTCVLNVLNSQVIHMGLTGACVEERGSRKVSVWSIVSSQRKYVEMKFKTCLSDVWWTHWDYLPRTQTAMYEMSCDGPWCPSTDDILPRDNF